MPQSIIRRMRVKSLYGKFSYEIPENGELGSPAILYGDNGVGKSSVLNIAFHLLSSANDRGHRGSLRKIPFKHFSVELTDGTIISADRENAIDDDIIYLKILKNEKLVAEWIAEPENSARFLEINEELFFRHTREKPSLSRNQLNYYNKISEKNSRKNDGVARGNQSYISKLNEVSPKIFYLNADRKLDGDSVAESGDTAEIRRMIANREMKSAVEILRISRSISLTQALENAARWVNRRAVSDANRGSENTHSAYEAILDQISIDYTSNTDKFDPSSIRSLVNTIKQIEKDTKDFSRYELSAELKMDKFKNALSNKNKKAVSISSRLIDPYIRGLSTRIEATSPLYKVLDTFVTTINEFLTGKELYFKLSQGFYIKDENGSSLNPNQLSSGEQQLLLIFSYVLAARDYPSVFIIDEPEISLNIKWQRKIVNSLLSVAEKSTIQFIFASHSLELIAQHADRVVEIGRS